MFPFISYGNVIILVWLRCFCDSTVNPTKAVLQAYPLYIQEVRPLHLMPVISEAVEGVITDLNGILVMEKLPTQSSASLRILTRNLVFIP